MPVEDIAVMPVPVAVMPVPAAVMPVADRRRQPREAVAVALAALSMHPMRIRKSHGESL